MVNELMDHVFFFSCFSFSFFSSTAGFHLRLGWWRRGLAILVHAVGSRPRNAQHGADGRTLQQIGSSTLPSMGTIFKNNQEASPTGQLFVPSLHLVPRHREVRQPELPPSSAPSEAGEARNSRSTRHDAYLATLA
jgi:hypothetical protein